MKILPRVLYLCSPCVKQQHWVLGLPQNERNNTNINIARSYRQSIYDIRRCTLHHPSTDTNSSKSRRCSYRSGHSSPPQAATYHMRQGEVRGRVCIRLAAEGHTKSRMRSTTSIIRHIHVPTQHTWSGLVCQLATTDRLQPTDNPPV